MLSLATDKAARIVEYKKRKVRHDELTVPLAKRDEYVEQGWSVVAERKNGLRIKKSKSIDILLENDFWCILYLLGYHTLNTGRKFEIEITEFKNKKVRKQIDVFAVDDETIIVAECKASEVKRKRSLQKELGEFHANKGPIARAIKTELGSKSEKKILWLFVTRNIEWSASDIARAAEYQIRAVTERELRYFSEVAKRLGPSGRFQFHATYLANAKVASLADVTVPAIKTRIGGTVAYIFVAPARKLLPISFVNHRDLRDPEAAPSYQRLIVRSRLHEVAQFVKGGGYFANAIIMNFKEGTRFDQAAKVTEDGTTLGTLTLPNKYKSAWIIDGQHRLYGYAELNEDDETHRVPVVAFDGLGADEEGRLFKTINSEQKRVSRRLLDELQGEQELHSPDKARQTRAIAARIIEQLRSEVGGPFEDKFKSADLPGPERLLTLTSIANGIVGSGLIGRIKSKADDKFIQGPLSGDTPNKTIDSATSALSAFFDLVRQSNEARWDGGKAGMLCTNVAVEAYVRLFGELCEFIHLETRNDPRELTEEELISVAAEYLAPVLKFNRDANDSDFSRRFKVPFGSGGPARYYFRLCELVRSGSPSFQPAGLEDYVKETAEQLTENADKKIRIIQSEVPAFIVGQLKTAYPGDKFLQRAVKNHNILVSAFEKQSAADPDEQGDLETYIDFIDFKKVVETKENWPLFSEFLSIRIPEEKHAARYIRWFDEINRLRRIAAHPYGKRYTEKDVELLEAVFDGLIQNGVISASVEGDAHGVEAKVNKALSSG